MFSAKTEHNANHKHILWDKCWITRRQMKWYI